MQLKRLVLTAALSMAPGLLHAQFDFKIADRTVQVHSFMTQGYMYGTANSFLTLRNGGSFAMTDGGVNVSTNITDNLHVAAQAYDRSIGSLGKGTLNLDFAYADRKSTRLNSSHLGISY